jgi:hypothetical protein
VIDALKCSRFLVKLKKHQRFATDKESGKDD